MRLFGYFWRVIALIHFRKWEGHDFFRKKILKYPGPPPPPNKNVPSLILRRIGISGSYRMFFPSRFRPFLPLGSRSLYAPATLAMRGRGKKRMRKTGRKAPKESFSGTRFFEADHLTFERGGEYGWFGLGTNFFCQTSGDIILSFICWYTTV